MSKLQKSLLILLFSWNLPALAHRLDLNSKLYGGKPVVPSLGNDSFFTTKSTEYPYMVEIVKGINHACGGTLLRPNAVLTAAHCFDTITDFTVLQVVAGNQFLWKYGKSITVQSSLIKEVFIHPQYWFNEDADIAVVEVATPFDLNQYVNVISKLPQSGQVDSFFKEDVVLLGWGLTPSHRYPSKLLKIDATILTTKQCRKVFEDNNVVPEVFCAMGKNQSVLCNGDSGGPVVIHDKSNPVNDILVGVQVVSWNTPDPDSYLPDAVKCDVDKPSVATSIAFFRRWIDSVLNGLSL